MTKPQTIRISFSVPLNRRTITALSALRAAIATTPRKAVSK